MPPPRKILILSLTRRGHLTSLASPGAYVWKRLAPLYLHCVLRILRLCGYRFTTVSSALAEPVGRFACLTFDVADEHLLTRVLPTLEKQRATATVFVPTLPVPGQLNWGALQALMLKGWEVGSLGHEAVDLTERSYTDQKHLVGHARQLLTDLLGAAPRIFAYPFGAYDATTVSCVREAGFVAALTLRRGINDSDSDHGAYHLRRLPLTGSLWRDLLLVIKTSLSSSHHLQPPVIRPQSGREGIQPTGSGY